MAYSDELAERVRELLGDRSGVTERKMFGGVAWMIEGNMACGVIGDGLLVRLGPDGAERALAQEHVGPMEFTGRRMGGFVVVDAEGVADPSALGLWVDAGAEFAAGLPPKST